MQRGSPITFRPFSFTVSALLAGAATLAACSSVNDGDTSGTGGAGALPPTGGATASGGSAPTGGTPQGGAAPVTGGTASGGASGGSVSGVGGAVAGAGAGGGGASGGAPVAGGAGMGGSSGGTAGGGAGGAGAGAGGKALAPAMLSQTGLYTSRAADGTLMLAEGVREFEPKYWLWSDGSDKKRYVYLPPGSKIDTTDPDRWVLPVGTKLWKSFIIGTQLVETRLIERTGEGEGDFRFATYFWETPTSTDAIRMGYKDLLINAAGTTHDIPNGLMCERCHNTSKERSLGFSALQLNHDLGGLNLATLVNEGWLTSPIPLDIKAPGADQQTQDALGYLHANCGNCHNDSPGLPLENVPAPQLLLRLSVKDKMLEDTGAFKTAINQKSTASSELSVEYRIKGGSVADSAVHFRMTQRMIEDQMPPIGTELQDDTGLDLIQKWIMSLPPPGP